MAASKRVSIALKFIFTDPIFPNRFFFFLGTFFGADSFLTQNLSKKVVHFIMYYCLLAN